VGGAGRETVGGVKRVKSTKRKLLGTRLCFAFQAGLGGSVCPCEHGRHCDGDISRRGSGSRAEAADTLGVHRATNKVGEGGCHDSHLFISVAQQQFLFLSDAYLRDLGLAPSVFVRRSSVRPPPRQEARGVVYVSTGSKWGVYAKMRNRRRRRFKARFWVGGRGSNEPFTRSSEKNGRLSF
jgi:hypothetical protein